MKICLKCGTKNSNNAAFCESCGTKLTSVTQNKCSRCQMMNISSNRFCENCGYEFEMTENVESGSQSAEIKVGSIDESKGSVAQSRITEQATSKSQDDSVVVSAQTIEKNKPSKEANRAHRIKKHSNAKWWFGGTLIAILIVAGSAYLFYRRTSVASEPTVTHQEAKKSNSKVKTSSVSSSSSSSSSESSSAETNQFDETQVKNDIATTIGTISGNNSVYVSPVDSKQSVLINNSSQKSASSIKLFILVTAYAMAKEGVFNLNDTHTLTDNEKVGGTGVIQNMDAGTKLTYQEILEHMIVTIQRLI